MRIPIYEEICLDHHDVESILALFKLKKFGQVPYCITTISIDQDFISEALDNISKVLITLNINPQLPYPVYIINSSKRFHPHLKIIESVNLLPKHFFNKIRRLKTKEAALLSKTSLIASKITNENITEKLATLSKILKPQRKLYELSKEIHFYEKILDGLAGKLTTDRNKD
jgi:hypothetical protein